MKIREDLVPKVDSGGGLDCSRDGMTKQEFASDCDINTIVRRFLKTGVLPNVSARQGFFADVSAVPDYREMFSRVERASELFSELPAQVRRRFNNDPAALLEFVRDPKNVEEAIGLGLVEKVETKSPPVVPAVPAVGPPKAV